MTQTRRTTADAAPAWAVEMLGVHKRFGAVRANHGVDLRVRPGHIHALVGENGAGKSTLTNTLLGEARQDTGAVRESDGRGQHTTTARSLFRLPGGAAIERSAEVATSMAEAPRPVMALRNPIEIEEPTNACSNETSAVSRDRMSPVRALSKKAGERPRRWPKTPRRRSAATRSPSRL